MGLKDFVRWATTPPQAIAVYFLCVSGRRRFVLCREPQAEEGRRCRFAAGRILCRQLTAISKMTSYFGDPAEGLKIFGRSPDTRRLLAGPRAKPANLKTPSRQPAFASACFRVRIDNVVSIEKARVALDNDDQRSFVVKAEPGTTVSQRICIHRARGIRQAWPYATADVAIPFLRVKGVRCLAGDFPKPELCRVRTAVVAARYERRLQGGNRLQCGNTVASAFYMGRGRQTAQR